MQRAMAGDDARATCEQAMNPDQREGDIAFPLPLVRYRFVCAMARYSFWGAEEAAKHDVATLLWNGERDTMDPSSIEKADRFRELSTARCRCGERMVIARRDMDGVHNGHVAEESANGIARREQRRDVVHADQMRALTEILAAMQQTLGAQDTIIRHHAAQIDLLTRLATPSVSVAAPPPSLWDELGEDARASAWRIAGTQLLELARVPLVGALQRHLAPDDPGLRARMAEFLESPLGAAMLALLLSAGLLAVSGMGGAPKRLARELRVRGLADAGDVLVDLVAAPLRTVTAAYLRDDVAPAPAAPAPEPVPPALESGPEVVPTRSKSASKARVRR